MSAEAFHAHLDACPQCERNPFDLCPVGAGLASAYLRTRPAGPLLNIAEAVAATAMSAAWLREHRFHTPIGPSEQRMEPGTYTWCCPCVAYLTQRVRGGRDDEDGSAMRRASGEVTCEHCGLLYRQHPLSWHRSHDGQPYLHRLCGGGLVHL